MRFLCVVPLRLVSLHLLVEEDKTPLLPGQFALYFQSVPGRSYEIQSTEAVGAEWIHGEIVPAGSATQKRVVLDRPATNAFYRLKIVAVE